MIYVLGWYTSQRVRADDHYAGIRILCTIKRPGCGVQIVIWRLNFPDFVEISAKSLETVSPLFQHKSQVQLESNIFFLHNSFHLSYFIESRGIGSFYSPSYYHHHSSMLLLLLLLLCYSINDGLTFAKGCLLCL